MKKTIIAVLLCVCVALGLCVGGIAWAGEEPTDVEVTTPTPTAAPMQGFLYLTVSKLNFSLVGETENIYCGSIPADAVTWTSADEAVVTVENGVVTAVGVGSTTVSCEYNGERWEAEVGCLAETADTLMQLPDSVLRTPKRVPPVISAEPITWFDDAAIVGDSISYIMWQWESKYNYIGDVTFLVRGGTSLNGFANNFMNLYHKGKETPLETIVETVGVNKVFLMMGQNDLRYRTVDETMESWGVLVARIREKNPHVEIYIQSLIPEWMETNVGNAANEKIAAYNVCVEAFCRENGLHFVDVAPYAVDHVGKMPTTYALDQSIHMNEEGCYQWMQLLKSYAFLQENKGE